MIYEINAIESIELKSLKSVEIVKKDNLFDTYKVQSYPLPNGIRLVSEDVLNYLLSYMMRERDTAIAELLKVHGAKAQNTKLKNRNEVLKKELEEAKKELKELNQMYGKYISPFSIIDELYRGIMDEYMILVKRDKFKLKVSEKQFDYWIGIFISLKIVRRIDKSKLQSRVGFYKAHDILFKNESLWNI